MTDKELKDDLNILKQNTILIIDTIAENMEEAQEKLNTVLENSTSATSVSIKDFQDIMEGMRSSVEDTLLDSINKENKEELEMYSFIVQLFEGLMFRIYPELNKALMVSINKQMKQAAFQQTGIIH
jgi:hypothetical protein